MKGERRKVKKGYLYAMQYSPKLKKAMVEIKDILSKYDIGGVVIIHTPGYSEFLNKLDPTYSCIKFIGDEVRFRSKLADYDGDKEAWQKTTTESLNLLQSIVESGVHVILPLMDLTESLETLLKTINSPGKQAPV